jgi:hypothetical protein
MVIFCTKRIEKKEMIMNVIEVVGGIIERDGRYLLGKRPVGKSLGGHWEFYWKT